MTRSGRSALVDHHPWLRRLCLNFPGRGLPSCNPWDSRLPHDALAPAKIHAGSKGVAIARLDVLTSPATWLDASLSVIDTATGNRLKSNLSRTAT
jgi:hypothetical protein